MTHTLQMIPQSVMARAYAERAVESTSVVSEGEKCWYVTFVVRDPGTGEPQTFALQNKKKALRTWADPRKLFAFLARSFGVGEGAFNIVRLQESK